MNVIYLISCTSCNEEYAGSVVDVKLLVISLISVGTHRITMAS